MHIRKMEAKDIPGLAVLYEQFWNEKSNGEKMLETFKKICNNPNYSILNAFEEEKLAGTILGVICDELYGECRPFMVIEDFIVDKNFRRKGIGRRLLKEIEKIAVENNCCNIILVTETEREDARGFYESNGFKKDKYKGYKKSL